MFSLRKNTCEKCKLDKWNDESIPLEVHHRDGDRTNNELSNLELLCCNCHAQTDFYRHLTLILPAIPLIIFSVAPAFIMQVYIKTV